MRFVLLEEPFSPAKISCVPEVLTMNTNTIQHYLSADGIRLTVADTSNVSLEAEAIHHLPPASARILAKAMTGAAILINDFKNHEGISIRWVTGSPLGAIHVDA